MHKLTLALLASFLPVSASFADGMDALFLKQVYANGGDTLYCQESFQPGDRISVEQIYDERRLAQHFGCRSSRLCENNPQFSDIRKDRHALFPVTRRAELDRRRTLFGDLPDTTEKDSNCGYKQSFQVFEPPVNAKGTWPGPCSISTNATSSPCSAPWICTNAGTRKTRSPQKSAAAIM